MQLVCCDHSTKTVLIKLQPTRWVLLFCLYKLYNVVQETPSRVVTKTEMMRAG